MKMMTVGLLTFPYNELVCAPRDLDAMIHRVARTGHSYHNCVMCEQPFTEDNVYSALGWRETQITGTCERCFDEMFDDSTDTDEVSE